MEGRLAVLKARFVLSLDDMLSEEMEWWKCTRCICIYVDVR